MSETNSPNLSGVADTSLLTLYLRAMESQRPDALIQDEKAVEAVARMDYNADRFRQYPMSDLEKATVLLRCRQFDHYARDFLRHYPQAVVVHIGCGLDTRFERVDNGCRLSSHRLRSLCSSQQILRLCRQPKKI